MPIDSAGISRACRLAAVAMRNAEQELNAADGRLGDGDTGITMRRLFDRLEEAVDPLPADLGALFQKLGTAAAGATGSSLGTLCAVALMAAARSTRGRETLEQGEVAELLRTVLQTLQARGGASLGDKTVLDSIEAVASALEADEPNELGGRAVAAARAALVAFRDRPCRIGRARMFGERSIGVDDPGMLAFTRLVEGILAESGPAPPSMGV